MIYLVIYQTPVNNFAELFNSTLVDRASDSMMARRKAVHFSWLGPELPSVALSNGAQLMIFFCFVFGGPLISGRLATRYIF